MHNRHRATIISEGFGVVLLFTPIVIYAAGTCSSVSRIVKIIEHPVFLHNIPFDARSVEISGLFEESDSVIFLSSCSVSLVASVLPDIAIRSRGDSGAPEGIEASVWGLLLAVPLDLSNIAPSLQFYIVSFSTKAFIAFKALVISELAHIKTLIGISIIDDIVSAEAEARAVPFVPVAVKSPLIYITSGAR